MRRSPAIRQLVLVSLAFAFVACDSTDSESGDLGDLVLSLASDGGSIGLQSSEIYPCSNFTLSLDVEATSDRVEIEVLGVNETDVCATALGPATGTAEFADGANRDAYAVQIEQDGAVDRYETQCESDSCELVPVGRTTFTRLADDQGF